MRYGGFEDLSSSVLTRGTWIDMLLCCTFRALPSSAAAASRRFSRRCMSNPSRDERRTCKKSEKSQRKEGDEGGLSQARSKYYAIVRRMLSYQGYKMNQRDLSRAFGWGVTGGLVLETSPCRQHQLFEIMAPSCFWRVERWPTWVTFCCRFFFFIESKYLIENNTKRTEDRRTPRKDTERA